MVSVCLYSDALLQHLPSYLGFSYLGHGVSLQGCSSKAQLLLLTLDEGYLLTAALSDLKHEVAPLGRHRWPQVWGGSSPLFLCRRSLALSPAAPDLGCGVTPLGCGHSGMRSSQLLPSTSYLG